MLHTMAGMTIAACTDTKSTKSPCNNVVPIQNNTEWIDIRQTRWTNKQSDRQADKLMNEHY